MRTSPIKVLIVDDGELFAESLRRVLEQSSEHRIEVCAVAHDGLEAIEHVGRCHPELILMDVKMPNLDGISATQRILEQAPETRVIVLTNYDDDEYVFEAIQAGAAGYLLKDISPERLIETIEGAADGLVVLSSSIATKLSSHGGTERATRMPPWFESLSRREHEIMACMLKGNTNKEIAIELNIAEQTVRNHVSEIYFKADIHDRVKLIDTVRRLLLSSPHNLEVRQSCVFRY